MLNWILSRPSSFLREDGKIDYHLFDQLMSISGRIENNGELNVDYMPCDKTIPFEIEARLFVHQSGGGLQSVDAQGITFLRYK